MAPSRCIDAKSSINQTWPQAPRAGQDVASPPQVARNPAADYWVRAIDDMAAQVADLKEKVVHLERQINNIRTLMAQRVAEDSLPSPPLSTASPSPPGYGVLSPAPPSINQQPSRNGDSVGSIRASARPQLRDQAGISDGDGDGDYVLARWAYETSVEHSTPSSMRRDGASD